MGIQPINAPLRQMRRPAPPAPSEDLTELAGSREPARIPQRQRGLWSFLTWPFVIAPIVAAEASLVGNGHALATEDQDDRAADHGREQPDVPADHEQIVAGAAHTPDDSRDDETDAPRLVATTPKALHDADAHDKVPVARDTVATESQAGDTGSSAGGGGGGGSNGSGPDDNNSSDVNSSGTSPSGSNASPGSETAAIGSSSELSGKNLSSLIPAEISHQIVIGDSPNWVDVLVGGESGLAHTTSAVVSTLTSSVADILSPVGLGTSVNLNDLVNLKDVLGFDLHVNSIGEFIATDLEAALDLHPSYLIANTGSTVLSPVAEGLSALNLGTSNILDGLLGGNDHSFVGHVGNLTAIISSDDAIKGNPLTADLNSNGTASLEKLADAPLPNLSDFSLETGLPVVSTAPVVGAVSDLAHVSIVGEATAMTPGHSIDFSAPALPESDVLFRGNNYTDYHVALQTTGPSAESNSIPATTIGVGSTHDATSLAHVDSPAVNLVTSTSTVQHQDTSLTHISTTLDDLGLRSHTH